MRRNRELNSWEKKDLARRMYAKRQATKVYRLEYRIKGYLKYKDLIKYSEKYGEVDIITVSGENRKKRPGVHSKSKTSNLKNSVNYKKKYRGQGR